MKSKILALLLGAIALLGAGEASAYTTSFYTSHSVLSDGHCVKIEVDTTGIYEISHEQLRALGFTDPTAVKVYGYGGVLPTEQRFDASYPDDLPQTASMHTDDGRLLFYGEGTTRLTLIDKQNATAVRNAYDRCGYYFLSDYGTRADITTQVYKPSSAQTTIVWNYAMKLIEREVQNPGKASVFFHGPKLSAGQSEDFTFDIEDFHPVSDISGRINGFFQYTGALLSSSSMKFPITTKSDGITISSTTLPVGASTTKNTVLYRSISGSARFLPAAEGEGTNTEATFTVSIPDNFNGTYAAIDRAILIYPRVNSLAGRSELCINLPKAVTNQRFNISGAPAGTEVWNVTDPTNIYRYELSYDAATSTISGSLGGSSARAVSRLFAFDPAATHRIPRVVGGTVRQNLHGSRNPDMLIVTNTTCREAAEELARIHRAHQGFDVLVVDQEQVFNEFSSGTRHPNAVRRLAKMFYDRDNTKLRYLLLYGHATYDHRSIESDDEDYLISFSCESSSEAEEYTTNYTSDFYFGMLADGYAHGSIFRAPTMISIGRIPASTTADAADANYKIRRYFENPPSVRNYLRTLFLSCEGDNESHLSQSNDASAVQRATSDAFTPIHADDLLYRKDIDLKMHEVEKLTEQALNSGVGYFTYSGHGNKVALSGTYIMEYHHVNKYTYDTPPFAMLATCSAWPLDQDKSSLSEKMLYARNGGMIGVLAACRSVYLEHNRTFNTEVSQAYAEAADGTCFGDLARIARNSMIDSGLLQTLGNNTLCYNYCGDPAIPINAPTHRIDIESINGATAEGEGTIEVDGMAYATVKAHINDRAGNLMSSFNGSATIEVHESPVYNQFDGGGNPFEVMRDHDIIAAINVPVTNGVIDGKVLISNPAVQGVFNRLTIVAVEENGATAAGGTRALRVAHSATPDDDVDTSSPVIEEIYIDSPAFASGDIVGTDITLYAVIDPSATGLEYRQTAISNTTSLTLDGNRSLSKEVQNLSFGDDDKMHLKVPLADLSYGRHSLTLKAVNRLGKSDIATVDFTVQPSYVKAKLTVDEQLLPARTDVTIGLEASDDITVDRLIIADTHGNTVHSRQNVSFPFVWDLKDNNGSLVADGVYHAHAVFSHENTRGGTPVVDIIVVK